MRRIEEEIGLRNATFQFLAARFPTHRMHAAPALAAAWRTLYYSLRPTAPFPMKTAYYRLWAHPRRGTLTRAVIRRGQWEPEETRAFVRLLRPGAFVVDAGANFGHYTLVAANIVGPDGLVIAFEPHPDVFGLLQANAALQPYRNIVTEPAALGDRAGALEMITDEANPGGHSLLSGNVRRAGARITVPVHCLDDYLRAAGLASRRLGVLKIDVQGFEAKVIAGARLMIARHRPAVFCEVTPAALTMAGDSHLQLLDFFRARDYAVRVIGSEATGQQGVGYEAFARLLASGAREYWDVLFTPSEHKEAGRCG